MKRNTISYREIDDKVRKVDALLLNLADTIITLGHEDSIVCDAERSVKMYLETIAKTTAHLQQLTKG